MAAAPSLQRGTATSQSDKQSFKLITDTKHHFTTTLGVAAFSILLQWALGKLPDAARMTLQPRSNDKQRETDASPSDGNIQASRSEAVGSLALLQGHP